MEENNNATKVKEGLQKLWDSFTDEQKEKAKECESVDELLALAGKLGVELPDELLESVSGGVVYNDGSYLYVLNEVTYEVEGVSSNHCNYSNMNKDYAIEQFIASKGVSRRELTARQYRDFRGDAKHLGVSDKPKVDIDEYYGQKGGMGRIGWL